MEDFPRKTGLSEIKSILSTGYPLLVFSVLRVEQGQGWAWAIGMRWWCYGPKGNHSVTRGRAQFGQVPNIFIDTIEIH